MRKRRVILINNDPRSRNSLKRFFDARGYETLVFREATICPVYGGAEICPGPHRCGDIVIVSYNMHSMNGIDLLAAQHKHGCGLSSNNKAILAGSLPDEGRAMLAALGSALFQHPLDFKELEKWVTAREAGMELDRPVAIKRREL